MTFTAPVNAIGDDYASLSFTVTDSHGGVSNEATVQINIAPNNLAVAAQLDTIYMDEGATSDKFLLYGTDEDVVDESNVVVIITSLPIKATLYSVDGGVITMSGATFAV